MCREVGWINAVNTLIIMITLLFLLEIPMNTCDAHTLLPSFALWLYRISGIECVCQKNARLRVLPHA